MTPFGTPLHFRTENENLSSSVDVLHKTKNLAISRCCFADDGKEMDKSENRTCRACKAIVFTHTYIHTYKHTSLFAMQVKCVGKTEVLMWTCLTTAN